MFDGVTTFNGKRTLEVGCGLGGFSINLAKKGASHIGLDISPTALQEAKRLAKQLKVDDKIDFILGDVQNLPFKEQEYDIVVCSETLEHVDDSDKGLKELVRVTKNSGHVAITLPNILSTMFPVYLILLVMGQPQYAKKFLHVEKEGIFHCFNIKTLFSGKNLDIVKMDGTDFLYLPPRVKKLLKIENSLRIISNRIENYFNRKKSAFRFLGANIGVLAQKRS
jgi:ubiquinone/menaquinone biosynthesis C-methylase UbiE